MNTDYSSCHAYLCETDPEFVELFDNFAFKEVTGLSKLDDKTRLTAVLAALIGCGAKEEYKNMLSEAIKVGLTAEELKEIAYHATPYLGIGRALPFIHLLNDYFKEHEINLPLSGQKTVSQDQRAKAGVKAIKEIFDEDLCDVLETGPANGRHIDYWLASNCFGDYFTRKGLDIKQREMITFCFISAQGGCEIQLTDHAEANMRVGNNKEFLLQVAAQCLPYIGYPRSLNAIRCINEAAVNYENKRK